MSPRLDALSLVARDLPATLAFYRRLGLDIPPEADTSDHVEVAVGGLRLMIDPVTTMAGFDSSFDPDADLGGTSLAFLCADPAEVDRVHAELVAAGHASHLDPFDAEWGQRYATVLDPNGNSVDLFASLG